MDIRDVSVDLNRTSRSERRDQTRSGSATSKAAQSASNQDFFDNSGRLGAVRELIHSLIDVPEVREDAVARAKSLLASGELDSPASAAKAAEGLFAEAEGYAG